MSQSRRVVVIGAGPVGVNAALMLDKQGYDVTLIERTDDILIGGAAATTNIIHSDGFEYHKPGHSLTGQYCIDGAITKAMLFPNNVYLTNTCTPEKPIRFFVSENSEGVDGLTKENFAKNAENMREHFTQRFEHFSKMRGRNKVEKMLGRNPETFAHPLKESEYSECDNIVSGYAGSGAGVNMPHYYAFLKAALRESNVKLKFRKFVENIPKQINEETYKVTCFEIGSNMHEPENIIADQIIIAVSHNATQLTGRIRNSDFCNKDGLTCAPGTYYLNSMTYVKLPATTDKEKIDAVSRLNFTLQANGGCMFACIVPPNKNEDGYGAIYYPSENGSQLQKHLYSPSNPVAPEFLKWDVYIDKGLTSDNKRVKNIMEQAYTYYPFLKDYAVVDKTLCRSVFNADVPDSDCGLERRVRGLIDANIVTTDGRVTAFWGPKWTTSEMVAMIATDYVKQKFGDKPLPKDEVNGFGPTSLDVEQITRDLHFRNVKMDVQDAYHYARMNQLPERIVDPTIKEFKKSHKERESIAGKIQRT